MLNPSNLIGARLGPYDVQAFLGSGGMATVYRGFDRNLQRSVALKVLSTVAAQQPGVIERFRQEALILARLRHPNIVHVYDFGIEGEVAYIVQELLPGPTLAERLEGIEDSGQPMARRAIMDVLHQLAGALDAAHAAGVIHRDVKPSNAIYNDHGVLVLADFGIAKNTLADGSQTQAGVVLGTPVYVSPEQARGEPLTPASDIYSLGVVLYQMIGGRPPFDAPVPLATVLKHLNETPPPLRGLRAALPTAVEGVVQRALDKQPERRFATAGALAAALEQAWPEAPAALPADIHARPTAAWASPPAPVSASSTQVSRHRVGRMVPALAATLVAVLLGGMLLAWQGASASGEHTAQATAVAGAPSAATKTPGPEAAPAGPLESLRGALGPAAGPELRASTAEAERALAAGDSKAATKQLGRLQQQVLQARRKGEISPETMRAALEEIQRAADAAGLRLPLRTGGS